MKKTKPIKAPKKSLKAKLKTKTKPQPAVRLNLGCGVALLPGFINVDNFLDDEGLRGAEGLYANTSYPAGAKFVKGDMCALPFKDNYADYIESLEALEHLPFRKVEVALKEMYRVLKPGGKVALLIPDMDDMCRIWTDKIEGQVFDHHVFFTMIQMFYGNQIHDGEYHTAGFTKTYINGVMHAIGFPEANIKVTMYPHGTHPPEFQGAKWNLRDVFVIGMMLVEATK